MGFDGFVMRAMVHELQVLVQGRISKVYQPSATDILLHIRTRGENRQLLLSAHPTIARVHLSSSSLPNPPSPTGFCMLLRKHLEGGTILAVQQPGMERILQLDVAVRNELGDAQVRRVVLETMGRHSNLLLLKQEDRDWVILDSIRHVHSSMSRVREVLPKRPYLPPPGQDKINPFELDRQQLMELLSEEATHWEQDLLRNLYGLSPALAKEFLYRAQPLAPERLWEVIQEVLASWREHQYQPTVTSGAKRDFHLLPLTWMEGEHRSYPTLSQCLEEFYAQRAQEEWLRQKGQDLMRLLTSETAKNERKLEKLRQELKEAREMDKWKKWGDLLTANLHLIESGQDEVTVVDYYDPELSPVRIPLDKSLSPAQNAQAYYRRYNKAKNSQIVLQEQIRQTEAEQAYLESVLAQLPHANLDDLEEIREELAEQGYLKKRRQEGKKKNTPSEFAKYRSSEGVEIWVGKNNKQNDRLTRLAARDDTWLHVKDIPGSHVVIRGKQFGSSTLQEAALLAAYYSKAKSSSNVPVDYTLIKHVHKPSGAKPGFVIYENQKTLYVTPSAEKVQPLLERTLQS